MKYQMCASLLVLALILNPTTIDTTPAQQTAASGSPQNSTENSFSPDSSSSSNSSESHGESSTTVAPTTINSTIQNPETTTVPGSSSTDASTTVPKSTTESSTGSSTESTPSSSSTSSTEASEHSTTTVNVTVTEVTSTTATTEGGPSSSSLTGTSDTTGTTTTPTTSTSITTPSSTSTSTTPPVVPVPTDVLISETNVLLASEDLFVELKGASNESLSGLILVVFDGTSATEKKKVDFSDGSKVFPTPGILIQSINSKDVESVKLAVIALYPTESYNSSVPYKGFMDFAILSTDPSAQLNAQFKETMLPHDQPLVVKTGLSSSQILTLSRCGSGQKNASLFGLFVQSKGQPNACNLTSNGTIYTLQLQKKGSNCSPTEADQSQNELLEKQLVWEINRRCQCGLTTQLVNGSLSCARYLYLDFSIKESYMGQAEQVIAAFSAFTQSNKSLTVDSQTYSVINCTSNCRASSPHHQSDKANTTVTVAVVLSCVVVFLIILVAVILYMRGKRRGIIRQFRMTRLQEDDDMDDMDDFIGGGEASFSARS